MSNSVRILTLLGNNYGGCLQAYALYQSLKKYEEDVKIIEYYPFSSNKNIKYFLKSIIYYKRNKRFSDFRNSFMDILHTNNILKDDFKSIYIVGSDQVWNPCIDFEIRKNYYLKFVNDKSRKNSYAASIGVDIIDNDKDNIKLISDMLLDFNFITVREKTANTIISNIVDAKISTVLDPTLLLTSYEWEKLITKNVQKEKYICVYTLGLDNQYCESINYISELCGFKIVDIYYKKRFNNELRNENNYGPVEFISSIYNSEFVITNSFHGTVFAVLFHKKFITITRGNMNSRIYDLLSILGLEDRIVSEEKIKTHSKELINKDIDYIKVDKILEIERKNSLNHLKEMIYYDGRE